jgi:hypothetical protein
MAPGQPGKTPANGKPLRGLGDWLRQASKLLLAGLALLAVGFFGGPIGGNLFFWLLFLAGLVLLLAWVSQRYGFGLPRILGKEQVIEQWDILIGGGQGSAEEVFGGTQTRIIETKAPDIQMERRDISPGVLRGVLGGKRPFLVIANTINFNLRPYRMYINARDYGNSLQVSWYVVYKPGFWRKLLALFLLIPFLNLLVLPFYLLGRLARAREAGPLDLDLFDLQDLVAYVTNAHHCVLQAVERLMVALHQDPSKIERRARGFLGIS